MENEVQAGVGQVKGDLINSLFPKNYVFIVFVSLELTIMLYRAPQ